MTVPVRLALFLPEVVAAGALGYLIGWLFS